MKTRLFYVLVLSVSFIFSPLSFSSRNKGRVVDSAMRKLLENGRSNKPQFDIANMVVANNKTPLTQKETESVVDALIKKGYLEKSKRAELIDLIRSSEVIGDSVKKLSEQLAISYQNRTLTANVKIVLNFYRAMKGIKEAQEESSNPPVANVLRTLLSRVNEMLTWDSGPRQRAFNLIKTFSAFKMGEKATVVNNKGTEVTINPNQKSHDTITAHNEAFGEIEGIHRVATLRARKIEIVEKCRI